MIFIFQPNLPVLLFSCFEDEERLKMTGGAVAVNGLPEHHNKTKRLKNEQQLTHNNNNNSDY